MNRTSQLKTWVNVVRSGGTYELKGKSAKIRVVRSQSTNRLVLDLTQVLPPTYHHATDGTLLMVEQPPAKKTRIELEKDTCFDLARKHAFTVLQAVDQPQPLAPNHITHTLPDFDLDEWIKPPRPALLLSAPTPTLPPLEEWLP
jgi:hypothetical protein